jgi:hypothetical protein
VEFSAKIQTMAYTRDKNFGDVCGWNQPFYVCHYPEMQTESGEQTIHKSSI